MLALNIVRRKKQKWKRDNWKVMFLDLLSSIQSGFSQRAVVSSTFILCIHWWAKETWANTPRDIKASSMILQHRLFIRWDNNSNHDWREMNELEIVFIKRQKLHSLLIVPSSKHVKWNDGEYWNLIWNFQCFFGH